jgi:hypothetical protein
MFATHSFDIRRTRASFELFSACDDRNYSVEMLRQCEAVDFLASKPKANVALHYSFWLHGIGACIVCVRGCLHLLKSEQSASVCEIDDLCDGSLIMPQN